MAQIDVRINGRDYRLACEDGEEGNLRALAAKLDGHVNNLRKSFGEIGESRLIVMAALTVTDQLDETQIRLAHLENELKELRKQLRAGQGKVDEAEDIIIEALTAASERIERLTAGLGAGP